MKKDFSKREKNILIILGIVLGIFVVYRIIVVPAKSSQERVELRMRTLRKSIYKSQRALRKSAIFKESNQHILEKMKQRGSDTEEMSAMLSQIEQVSKDVNMRIADVKPRKAKNFDLISQFSVSLSIEGTMIDIARFIYKLQAEPYHFEVEEVNISRRSARSEDLRCQLVIRRTLIP